MRPSLFLLSVATGIRIMYCKNDCLRDYQQEMKFRLFEEWELHRSVMVQMPTGTGKTHLLAAIVSAVIIEDEEEEYTGNDPYLKMFYGM